MSLEDLIEIANPDQPHCPVVLLLDTSGSMSGAPINALAQGLETFRTEVQRDELARLRVEFSIVTFGGDCKVLRPFAPVDELALPRLEAQGGTPLGQALLVGMEMLRTRKNQLRQEGIDWYRPWIFLFTDGSPTDMTQGDDTWSQVVRGLEEGRSHGSFSFFPIGVEDADMDLLKNLDKGISPLKLKGLAFSEFFRWLSRSLTARSRSTTGEQIQLENPTAPNGWATA